MSRSITILAAVFAAVTLLSLEVQAQQPGGRFGRASNILRQVAAHLDGGNQGDDQQTPELPIAPKIKMGKKPKSPTQGNPTTAGGFDLVARDLKFFTTGRNDGNGSDDRDWVFEITVSNIGSQAYPGNAQGLSLQVFKPNQNIFGQRFVKHMPGLQPGETRTFRVTMVGTAKLLPDIQGASWRLVIHERDLNPSNNVKEIHDTMP